MKNLPVLFVCVLVLLVAACKKKDSTTTTPTSTTAHPYYFKFTFNGTTSNFNSNQPQYMPFNANEVGGYQGNTDLNLYPSVGLRLSWPSSDTVKESDLMGLIGKTLYFSDTAIVPELTWDKDAPGTDSWISVDTANTSYNVKITNVTYLKKDTTLGYYVKTYVITGTCSAVMSNLVTTSVFSSGSFNFIISRRDL